MKGAYLAMNNKYVAPDFDVTVYEIEDVITFSIGNGPVDGGETGDEWWS